MQEKHSDFFGLLSRGVTVMNIGLYILFILEVLAAGVLVYAVQIPLRRKLKWYWQAAIWILKFVLLIVLAYLLIATSSPLLWSIGYPLCALYIAVLGDLLAEAVTAAVRSLRGKQYKYAAAAATLLFLGYGIWNMETIVRNPLEYHSAKLKNSYKLVFLSDLHYGSSQSPSIVKEAFRNIQNEQPDYLLLGGDLVDEYTSKEEMNEIFTAIAEIGVPTYYIYGNHDRQDHGSFKGGSKYSEAELEETITGNGITILYNEVEQVTEDLVFLGLEDPSRPDKVVKPKDLPERPADAYVVCLEHTPYQNDDIREIGADLQLSGHTHAGQLFPLRWVYPLVGLNTYGKYKIGTTDLYVSSGIAGWYLPFRNEARCHYEVIELKPE